MKKITLMLGAALVAFSASAQYKVNGGLREAPRGTVSKLQTRTKFVASDYNTGTAAKTTAAPGPRWYNHAEGLAAYNNMSTQSLYSSEFSILTPIWPDSTVVFSNNDGTPSDIGINFQSFGEMFAPATNVYNSTSASNRGKLRITATDAYHLDSVKFRGRYERAFNNDDSLMVVIMVENNGAEFGTFTYTSPDILVNHGIDSFGAIVFRNEDYQKGANIVSYRLGTAPGLESDTFYFKLDAARFADSLADGTHEFKIKTNFNVAAGGRAAMAVSFKPGVSWTKNTQIDNYNFFAWLSHEPQTPSQSYVVYPNTDQNMSYVLYKDTTNQQINDLFTNYLTTLPWTEPFRAEVHNVSWMASCTTCAAVGVNEVATGISTGEAFPNPARTTVTIPVTVKNAATVAVSLNNMLGQVVSRQNINAAAGQTQNAVFNTSSLANGVYIYTVEANGERVTDRIVVAH